MRILITGSRTWVDARALQSVLWPYLRNAPAASVTVVHGDCSRGADRIARDFTRYSAQLDEPHPADWAKLGKRAGFRRNQLMVSSGVDLTLAFLMPCRDESCSNPAVHGTHGTVDCIKRSYAAGIKTRIFAKGIHAKVQEL